MKSEIRRLRKGLGLPSPRRQEDDYYPRLLAVWDAREGWTGTGDDPLKPSTVRDATPAVGSYDPRKAVPLADALRASRGKPDDYYRAFKLITGEAYDDALWDTLFGSAWREALDEQEYRRLHAMPSRRRTGCVKEQTDCAMQPRLDLGPRGRNRNR